MVRDNDKHVISLKVSNKPGVLIRVALVFARRGYNIDSLVVSEESDPRFSRMTITASGDKDILIQIIKQLNKLVDVISAIDYTDVDTIERELSVLKVDCPPEKRAEIFPMVEVFKGKIVDIAPNTITFEAAGPSERMDALRTTFAPYGIRENVRTGKVIMRRGD
ncbi:MAG: acetolactate synthase small subunit [Spirochaetia bacterium]|nr:acetolactate synthase small subunit [Spirochaetia bacterium]